MTRPRRSLQTHTSRTSCGRISPGERTRRGTTPNTIIRRLRRLLGAPAALMSSLCIVPRTAVHTESSPAFPGSFLLSFCVCQQPLTPSRRGWQLQPCERLNVFLRTRRGTEPGLCPAALRSPGTARPPAVRQLLQAGGDAAVPRRPDAGRMGRRAPAHESRPPFRRRETSRERSSVPFSPPAGPAQRSGALSSASRGAGAQPPAAAPCSPRRAPPLP